MSKELAASQAESDLPSTSPPPPKDGTVLALDFGEKRIGVAVGEMSLGITHPLATIAAVGRQQRFDGIAALIREWEPLALVVGLPTHADGTDHEISRRARKFAQELERRFGLRVVLVDERLTTRAAAEALSKAGVSARKQKPVRDRVAAQLILQAYFDQVETSHVVA